MGNDDEQPDELQQQQQQQQQSTLPLLYLPIELAEEISLHFEGRAAAKLLRVSRSFHSLFLPRAWVDLDTFNAIKGDDMKLRMLEKYGHFVRTIDLTDDTTSEFIFDWLPFVKRATHLKVSIDYETTAEEADKLMKLIKQSEMMRTLYLRFDEYGAPVKFDELAAAINELEYLEHTTCEFATEYGPRREGGEWERAADFVDLLHPSKRSKLRLKMKFSRVPNEVDVRKLAPYVVELEAYGGYTCTVQLADMFFDVMDNSGQPLMFPQLKELSMTSCCFNREYYSIEGITVNRLPQLQFLHFGTGSCTLLDPDEPRDNEHEKYNWKPEYSGYAQIIVPSQHWRHLICLQIGIVSSSILMDIIDLNPQLQELTIGLEYPDVPIKNNASKYNHDEFQLDTILNRLPHLVDFSIGRLNSRIVVNSAAIPVTRRYNIDITIGCQMSITPSAVAYILQMPKLLNLTFNQCVLVDINETIQLLQSSATACGAKWLYWEPIEWHQDLVLAVTEKMPHLERFIALKCPKKHRAIFEAKYRLDY